MYCDHLVEMPCFFVISKRLWCMSFSEPRHKKTCLRACDQLRLKPDCSATATSYSLEVSAIVSRGIILSRQRTTKALIRLLGCAGWSAPLLFAYGIKGFSHDVAHLFSLPFGVIKRLRFMLAPPPTHLPYYVYKVTFLGCYAICVK